MSLQVGTRIPNCEMLDANGDKVRLADYGNGPLLLIFLRHLA